MQNITVKKLRLQPKFPLKIVQNGNNSNSELVVARIEKFLTERRKSKSKSIYKNIKNFNYKEEYYQDMKKKFKLG